MDALLPELEAMLEQLCAQGGPEEEDYEMLDGKLRETHAAVEQGRLIPADILKMLDRFPDVFSVRTLQGMALRKSHGYAGDFEMIERIYACHVTAEPALRNWDKFFQSRHAPRAVRNRKAYFHRLLDALPEGACVLKLGVGPGRSMFEWLQANPGRDIAFECVDVDRNAIEYARSLNRNYADRLTFHHANVFKFFPEHDARFDLIWAAGLFDYFDDRTFVTLGSRFHRHVASGRELVIGNFSTLNPTRAYMEVFGDWKLQHRSMESLHSLA